MSIKTDLLDKSFSTGDTLSSATMQAVTDALQPLNRSQAEIDAGVTPTNYSVPPAISGRFGDVADNATDVQAALENADAAGNISISAGADYGTHRISSDLTFTNRVTVYPGEILKPDSGVEITFNKWPNAGPAERIFDLSAGGSITWSLYDRHELPASWFGAIAAADADKSDQDVEINQAISSLGSRGGVVTLLGGDYFCSNAVEVTENTVIRGQGHQATGLRVSSSWADSDDHLILFQNGTSAQFGCRLESLNVSGTSDAFVTALILARSWNEQCGLKDVWIRDFMKYGLYLENYYGGSAISEINGAQFFASSDATESVQAAIFLEDPGFSSGWFQLVVKHATLIGNTTNGSANFHGIIANGRTKLLAQGVHGESCYSVMTLADDASAYGNGVQLTGDGSGTNVFSISDGWTGTVDVGGVSLGGGTSVVSSNDGALISMASEPKDRHVIYPSSTALAFGDTSIDVRSRNVRITTASGAIAASLPDGTEGQEIYLLMTTDGGSDAVITPSNFSDGSTLTFDDVGDDALLRFIGTDWKRISGSASVA